MRRKFAIAFDSSTNEQRAAFKEFVKANGLGWWYWINNFWLITDPDGKFTAASLREELSKIFPKVRLLVLSIDKEQDSWSGFGPKGEEKNMFTWLKTSWDKDLE